MIAYGPRPWQQTQWDWRAAGNFVCGGAGSGLIAFAAVASARGSALTLFVLAGLGLVSLGLLCVWFELGRPLRALNVFLNPRTSWMARESIAATLLFPVGLAAAFAMPELLWLAALLALAFVYCQGRMLQAAKGIVAWREPMLVPLMVVTGLTEGAGWYWLLSAAQSQSVPGSLLLFGALMLLRYVLWRAWRARLAAHAAPRALAAIDAAGRVLLVVGTLLPLALIATAALLPAGSSSTALAAAAGALAAVCGAWFKFTLVRRGGFNQGFALAHLPVRGARRQP